MRALRYAATLLALVAVSAVTPAEAHGQSGVRLIVHPATPVNTLPREEVSRLFLKKVGRWAGGAPVTPVDLRGSSPTRASFSRLVHRRSVDLLVEYWQRQIFSGRQTPPTEQPSEAAVVEFVRTTPGAIGYVSDAADVRGVRVVLIVPD